MFYCFHLLKQSTCYRRPLYDALVVLCWSALCFFMNVRSNALNFNFIYQCQVAHFIQLYMYTCQLYHVMVKENKYPFLSCSRCKIHRYIAAPFIHVMFSLRNPILHTWIRTLLQTQAGSFKHTFLFHLFLK